MQRRAYESIPDVLTPMGNRLLAGSAERGHVLHASSICNANSVLVGAQLRHEHPGAQLTYPKTVNPKPYLVLKVQGDVMTVPYSHRCRQHHLHLNDVPAV